MIKISPTTKVYVYAPKDKVTGGAELLHQLVHNLNNYGVNSYIVYISDNIPTEAKVPQEYEKYNIKVTTNVEDDIRNIVVIYEGIFNKIYSTSYCKQILWWLSVDNFYICSQSFLAIRDLIAWDVRMAIKQLFKRVAKLVLGRKLEKTVSLKFLMNTNSLHCYQSVYAQNFLYNKGAKEVAPLSDYINTDFYNKEKIKLSTRKDIVLYNPAKGLKFTQKLIDRTPHITWIPLRGMSRSQLIETFQSSKLYVDFGYHPGKDRLPREAALNGCCIITNKEGSAFFYEDVLIDRKYKFDNKATTISEITNQIEYVLKNYCSIISDFNMYQNQILKEEKIFKEQVENIFIIEND